jgi:hypothetical protein
VGDFLMVRIAFLSFAVLGVSGCAPQILQSNSSGGLIKTVGVLKEQSKAIEVADKECAKFGKISKVTRTDILSDTVAYDCVDK